MMKQNNTFIIFVVSIVYLVQVVDHYSNMSIILRSIREVYGGLGGPVVMILESLNNYTIVGLFLCLILMLISLLYRDGRMIVFVNLVLAILIIFLGVRIFVASRFIEGKIKQEVNSASQQVNPTSQP